MLVEIQGYSVDIYPPSNSYLLGSSSGYSIRPRSRWRQQVSCQQCFFYRNVSLILIKVMYLSQLTFTFSSLEKMLYAFVN